MLDFINSTGKLINDFPRKSMTFQEGQGMFEKSDVVVLFQEDELRNQFSRKALIV